MPLGWKVSNVISISSQETSAAAAPAAKAQKRIAPDRPSPGPPEMPAGTAELLGATSPAFDEGIGVVSCVSIGSAPSYLRVRAEVMRGDAAAVRPAAERPALSRSDAARVHWPIAKRVRLASNGFRLWQ